MQDFRNLTAWRKAHELTLGVYRATVKFPPEERYGLSGQMRRASASIAANIAEGRGRRGNTELRRFLKIPMGSASEVEVHLLPANDLSHSRPRSTPRSTLKSWSANASSPASSCPSVLRTEILKY